MRFRPDQKCFQRVSFSIPPPIRLLFSHKALWLSFPRNGNIQPQISLSNSTTTTTTTTTLLGCLQRVTVVCLLLLVGVKSWDSCYLETPALWRSAATCRWNQVTVWLPLHTDRVLFTWKTLLYHKKAHIWSFFTCCLGDIVRQLYVFNAHPHWCYS